MFLFIGGGLGIVQIVIILTFIILPLVLLLWALIDILRSDFKDSVTKLIWIIVVIFVPLVGAILYLVMRKGQKAGNSHHV